MRRSLFRDGYRRYPIFNIGNSVRCGNQTTIRPENRFCGRHPRDHQLEQGLLLNFIISEFSISPDTTLADIVSFKNHHHDELGRFRTQLTKLTQNLDGDKTIDVIRQEISDLYNNEFMPAFNDLKAARMPVEQTIFAGMGYLL